MLKLLILLLSLAPAAAQVSTTDTAVAKDGARTVISGEVPFPLEGRAGSISRATQFLPTIAIAHAGSIKTADGRFPWGVTKIKASGLTGTYCKICSRAANAQPRSWVNAFAQGGRVGLRRRSFALGPDFTYLSGELNSTQTVSQNRTFRGNTSFLGRASFGAVDSAATPLFTNTQMNDLATFLANGISTKTELHDNVNGLYTTNALVGGIAIPTSSTVPSGIGVVGLVTNAATVRTSTGDNTYGIAGYFQTRALANRTTNWGINPVCTDAVGLTNGLACYGAEVDVGPQNPISAYAGLFGVTAVIGGTASVWTDHTAVGGSAAFLASGNSPSRWWDVGFKSADNRVVTAAFLSGALCAAGGTCNSQGIRFDSYDRGMRKSALITSTNSGSITMRPPPGQVVRADSNLDATGTITGTRLISTVTTGIPPFAVASATAVANLNADTVDGKHYADAVSDFPKIYDASGTQQTTVHIVRGACTLGTNCSITFAGAAAFSSKATYDCFPRDATNPGSPVTVTMKTGSVVAFQGTGNGIVRYLCVGN